MFVRKRNYNVRERNTIMKELYHYSLRLAKYCYKKTL